MQSKCTFPARFARLLYTTDDPICNKKIDNSYCFSSPRQLLYAGNTSQDDRTELTGRSIDSIGEGLETEAINTNQRVHSVKFWCSSHSPILSMVQ